MAGYDELFAQELLRSLWEGVGAAQGVSPAPVQYPSLHDYLPQNRVPATPALPASPDWVEAMQGALERGEITHPNWRAPIRPDWEIIPREGPSPDLPARRGFEKITQAPSQAGYMEGSGGRPRGGASTFPLYRENVSEVPPQALMRRPPQGMAIPSPQRGGGVPRPQAVGGPGWLGVLAQLIPALGAALQGASQEGSITEQLDPERYPERAQFAQEAESYLRGGAARPSPIPVRQPRRVPQHVSPTVPMSSMTFPGRRAEAPTPQARETPSSTWAREWVTPQQGENIGSTRDPYQTRPPEPLYTPQERDALMERLKAGSFSALNPGKSDAVIRMEVAQEQADRDAVAQVRALLPKLLQGASTGSPTALATLKTVIPYYTQLVKPTPASQGKAAPDLSSPQGIAGYLASKSGTGADNLNYTSTFLKGIATHGDVNKAIEEANQARMAVTQGVAFNRGQGYGTGANTGPAAEAKTNLAGAVEQRKIDVQTTPQAGLGGKSPVQMTAEQKAVGGLADEQRKNEISMFKTRAILTDLDAQSKRIFTASSPGEAAVQRITGPVGAFTKTNPNAAAYNDTKESALGELARSISAERGVLTNIDIQRIQKAMPDWGDTRAIRDFKMSRLQAYIDILDQMNQALLAPGGIEVVKRVATQYKPQLDNILNDLERGSQGQAPPRQSRGVIGQPREVR